MLKIALAQINTTVGDLAGNQQKIVNYAAKARASGADIVVFPELSLSGYPPEDLLLRADFIVALEQSLQEIIALVMGITVLVGIPKLTHGKLHNAAVAFFDGKIICTHHKNFLPNCGVFDERRYFASANAATVFHCRGCLIAIGICEDIWHQEFMVANANSGAKILLVLNASPFYDGKLAKRQRQVGKQALAGKMAIIYVNAVGGQDELLFDGGSFATNSRGEIIHSAAQFTEALTTVDFDRAQPLPSTVLPLAEPISCTYQALVLGLADYIGKNGFAGVLLGLSGGVDSALVLALAVAALGANRVEAVLLPSRYTQKMSCEDANAQAEALAVHHHTINIEPAVAAFEQLLSPAFDGNSGGTTHENIQARCRGVLLMALSNKSGKLLLTTSNKSETAVGYATLYGDMAGGFAPIKDVPKILVYELAKYANTLGGNIPQRVLDRPPSAELSEKQTDADSLPPYAILDPILQMYIEQNQSAADIGKRGYNPADISRAISLVDASEHKRRQATIGTKISSRAFGRDWRFPSCCHTSTKNEA